MHSNDTLHMPPGSGDKRHAPLVASDRRLDRTPLRGLPFAHPTMLAPLEGVSHPPFRALLAGKGGIGCVCTEFVRVTSEQLSPVVVEREVIFAPGTPLSVQVMGNLAEQMADAAEAMALRGADIVDINLGCPVPKIVKKGVGAAMLKDLDLLYRVIAAMRARVPGLLSAKIRAGWDDKGHILAIGDAVQAAGADLIIVHPRRRADYYAGVADWRMIGELKAHLAIPVVGNGDCWYAADAFRMRAETGCDGVMLGRPALRNPWVFQQIDEMARGVQPIHPSGDDVVAWMEHVVATYRGAFGKDRFVIGKLKEWCAYLVRALPDNDAVRGQILRPVDVDGVMDAVRAVFTGRAARSLDLDAHGSLGLERSGSALIAHDEAAPAQFVGPRGANTATR